MTVGEIISKIDEIHKILHDYSAFKETFFVMREKLTKFESFSKTFVTIESLQNIVNQRFDDFGQK